MKRVLRKVSSKGDEVLAEFDTETVTKERLAEIEGEFNKFQRQGYFAANLGTKELIDRFDPDADILLLPRLQGGI